MKDIVKSILILAVIYLLLFFLVNTNRQSQVIQEKPQPVIITDTITNVLYDTLFIDHFETVKLRTTDTLTIIRDNIRVDSVFVEVPISVHKLDTTFVTDTTCLNIMIRNSGFEVKLDSLSYYFEYNPRPKKTNFFRDHFKFGVGVGAGLGVFTRKPDIFIGGGFYYCF